MNAAALTAAAVLVVAGLFLVVVNARKLIADWPRLKPVHNVDVTWIQVYLGLALLALAWVIGADPMRKLREPVPLPVSQEAQERTMQGAAGKQ